MFSYFKKKLGGGSGGATAPSAAEVGSAQDMLASLGLDPSMLADPVEDDADRASVVAVADAGSSSASAAAKGGKPKPNNRVAPAPAAHDATLAQLDADLAHIHASILSEGSDDEEEVILEESEIPDLEAQLAELAGIDLDELRTMELLEEVTAGEPGDGGSRPSSAQKPAQKGITDASKSPSEEGLPQSS